jgi:hypothetical protein
MKNLLNFFFSFDKLFKEKLIVPFFWLAIIVWGLAFFESFLAGINLGPLAFIVKIIGNIITILLALVIFRLLAELATAIFRINDNLSPDGGKSELVDIDPIAEARKAAEMAAARTREATKTVGEKASAATKSVRENVDDMTETVQAKAKSATASVKEKTKAAVETAKPGSKTVKEKAPDISDAPKPVKTKTVEAKPAASKTTSPKKRGRPASSKTKTTKPSTAKAKTTGKRGPKAGTKIPRDADGNLLKKDGTPRKKPGPRKS